MAERCRPKIPLEQTNKQEKLRAEADAEFDEAFGDQEDLHRMNDMFEEAFAGFKDFDNEDVADNENEPKTEEVNNAAAAAAQ